VDDETLCHHLEQLAAHLDVSVRYEPSAGKAGYCLLNGEPTIFIDSHLALRHRAAALARLLSGFDTEEVFLPPVVRSLLEQSREFEAKAAGRRGGNGGGSRPAEPQEPEPVAAEVEEPTAS
jgi:hypothetical protein